MTTSKLIIIILLITASFVACKKKKVSSDTNKPMITIVEPMALDTLDLSVEPEIHMEFTVTDNVSLDNLSVKLYNASNTLIYVDIPNVKGMTGYPYHEHLVPLGIVGTVGMKLVISATDANDNNETKTINFAVHP